MLLETYEMIISASNEAFSILMMNIRWIIAWRWK